MDEFQIKRRLIIELIEVVVEIMLLWRGPLNLDTTRADFCSI